jgi:hypothetical protein
MHAPIERPETLILLESSLYKQTWREYFIYYFPLKGIHFASIDLTTSDDDALSQDVSFNSMEQTLSDDMAILNEPAYTIAVARGPIQSLVAQYYLESLPLAGLVLVDPFLLPEDCDRVSNSEERRWKESIDSLMDYSTMNDGIFRKHLNEPPGAIDECTSSSFAKELKLLESLQNTTPRPLNLEPSPVPILVMYSAHPDEYRAHQCAERTATFHGLQGQTLKIPRNSGTDDVDWVMERVYEWYDESVA